MVDVIFLDSNSQRRVIGAAASREEVLKIINDFLKEHDFKSYYTRLWRENNEWCIDVGSWSEFFYVSTEINMAGNLC